MCKEEGIRHREYCQLRRDIRGSKEQIMQIESRLKLSRV